MVRLPARLTTRLAKARIAQVLNSAPPNSLIHCVDPADVLHPGSDAPVSREQMHALLDISSPVIWIGGSEPLLHAGMGHFVRALAQSGHCVFLETDGATLRRRIHEFQPQRGLFLTVRLASMPAPDSAFAVEGLRAARLSGFFTVIHSLVCEDSDFAELEAIKAFVAEKDVDGWLVTAESSREDVVCMAAEVRGLIRSTFWRQFSEHVEEALVSQTPGRELKNEQSFVAEHVQTEAGEEGVRIA